MKIGFLINTLSSGGAERATVSLSNYFVQHGHQVEIITFKNGDSFYPLDENVSILSAGFDEIEHGVSVKRLLGTVKRMFGLRSLVKSKGLDVLIGMSFSMTWYAVFAALFTSTVAVGTERNNPYKYKATKFNTFMRRLFYHFCGGFIFQTKKSSEFFTAELKDRDIIIPNAIFNEQIYSLEPPEKREKIICAVGRLTQQKRFDLLIDAFSDIADRLPEYKLLIFGEGELRSEFEAQAEKLGLSDRILLPGTNPEAVKIVNRMNAFVLSSDMEGMPNALMEAIAMGVPCVSTRCDMGPEELIEHGVNGLLVDTGDRKALAASIYAVCTNPELAEKLSENGRKMIKTHSIEAISEQWLTYLKKITD